MIHEQARVIELKGDQVIVEIDRQSGCQGCELSGACGTGSLGRLLGHRQKPVCVPNRLNLKRGDRVLLQLPEKSLMLSGLMVYLLPLLSMFLFSLLADVLFHSQDWVNVVGAVIGLFTGFGLSSWITHRYLAKSLQPQVSRQIV